MSPYELMIIINAHCSPSQPFDGKGAPIYHETMGGLIDCGLFTSSGHENPGVYVTTVKLHAYAKLLCMMPMPTQQWTITGMGFLVTDTP